MREDTTNFLLNPALRDEFSEVSHYDAHQIIRQAVEAALGDLPEGKCKNAPLH